VLICDVRMSRWVGHLGVSTWMGSLFVKTHRIHRIFNSKQFTRRDTMTDAKLFQGMHIIITLSIAVLSL
jgi:hypothetical protein